MVSRRPALRPCPQRFGSKRAMAWFVAAAVLVSCAEEDAGPTDIDWRGTWMLTSESAWRSTDHRLVATQLDTGVSVEIAQQRPSSCPMPMPDVVRIGDWRGAPDGHPRLLRLTDEGFVVEPDLLPPPLFGSESCQQWLDDERAVMYASLTQPSVSEPWQPPGLYIASRNEEGSAAAVRLDADTGSVSTSLAFAPDLSELFYTTTGSPNGQVYRVNIQSGPPNPTLIDEMLGTPDVAASQRWLVYGSSELPDAIRAFPLDQANAVSTGLTLPEPTQLGVSGMKWGGDDRLVLVNSFQDDAEVTFFLFSATSGTPEVSALPLGDLAPISSKFITTTQDYLIFAYQRGVAETRTKGIARIDPLEPSPVPTVIFEIPGDNPYAAIDVPRGSYNSNTMRMGWTDDQAQHHFADLDTTSGETMSLDGITQGCEAGVPTVSRLDEESSRFTVVCTLQGQVRAFVVDQTDPSRRVWLDEFDRGETEVVRRASPVSHPTQAGIVTTTVVPDPDPYSITGLRNDSVVFYSHDGLLRAQRSPDGWSPSFNKLVTLE